MRGGDDKTVGLAFPWVSALERRNRHAFAAHRTLVGGVILRRGVFRQRVIRHDQIDDRFHPIEYLDGRNHAAAGFTHQRGASLKRLSCIPHVVSEEHALAGELSHDKNFAARRRPTAFGSGAKLQADVTAAAGHQ